jgi:hypothetical protein
MPDNEKTDAHAKIGTTQPQPEVNMLLTSTKNTEIVVKKSLQAHYKEVGTGKPQKCPAIPPNLPRKVSVAELN